MNKAIFVDLDHTLIRPKEGRRFPIDEEDWEFIDKTVDYLQQLCNLDSYSILIVSNQGGIELGYTTQLEIKAKLNAVTTKLREKGLPIVHSLFYPLMEGYDRKPKPGMAYELARTYDLNLRQCIMIGDMVTDEQFAMYAGMKQYVDVSDI